MNQEILREISKITEEEREILENGSGVKQDLYTDTGIFRIDSKKFLEWNTNITIRPHTRFVDFPMHGHNYVEIMYVCQGSITHVIEGKEIVLYAGDMLFLNQHVKHAVKKAGQEDIGINFIALPEFFDIPYSLLDKDNILAEFIISAFRRDNFNPQYLRFCTAGNFYIENLMDNIASSLLKRDVGANINQVTMGLVFLHLLDNIEMIGKDSSQSYHDILVHTTLQYINRFYQHARLSEIADELHQSVSALSRIIKRHTGFTFKQLLQRQRFQKAVELLIATPLPIADIMEAVGYENSSYFYNQFQKRYKMSPREYRKGHHADEMIVFKHVK